MFLPLLVCMLAGQLKLSMSTNLVKMFGRGGVNKRSDFGNDLEHDTYVGISTVMFSIAEWQPIVRILLDQLVWRRFAVLQVLLVFAVFCVSPSARRH